MCNFNLHSNLKVLNFNETVEQRKEKKLSEREWMNYIKKIFAFNVCHLENCTTSMIKHSSFSSINEHVY